MIERIVLIKLDDKHATDEVRADLVVRAKRALSGVPGVRSLTVGIPCDDKSLAAWDLSIRLTFDAIDVIPDYIAHPEHRAFIDGELKPKMSVLKAWNFELGD